MRILLALGGKALLPWGEPASAANRRREVETAATAIAELAAEHEVIVIHGSGSHGGALELALRNRLPEREVVSILTEVVVAGDDPAFPEAEPHAIAEIRSLRVLVDSGALVICAAGGIPIALNGDGTMHEVEAVVDEDLIAALLARRLGADLLVMLSDDDVLYDAASMDSKVEAARRFTEATDRRAAIGALGEALPIARGEAGTQVVEARHAPATSGSTRGL